MNVKKTFAVSAMTGALVFGGAGMAQASPLDSVTDVTDVVAGNSLLGGANNSSGAIGGLVAAAVSLDRTVDIEQIQLVNVEGDVLSDIDVDVTNNNILNGLTVQALNENDIDIQDVVDVNVVDNVLVVVVDAL